MKGIVFTFRNKQKTIRLPFLKKPKLSLRATINRFGFQTIFVILFLLGLAIGAAGSRGVDESLGQRLDFLFITNIEARLDMSAFDIFLSCFAAYFLFVFAIFLCALSAWGFAAIPILSVIKGFSVGLSSAVIFAFYKVSGIGFYILIILPGAALFLITLTIYAKASFGLSVRFMRLTLFGLDKEPALHRGLKSFLKKSVYAFLSCGACAVLDMLLWILFANHFDF